MMTKQEIFNELLNDLAETKEKVAFKHLFYDDAVRVGELAIPRRRYMPDNEGFKELYDKDMAKLNDQVLDYKKRFKEAK